MSIGIIAEEIHRRGGMERAAAEVFERVAARHSVTAFATVCEMDAPGLTWIPVHPLSQARSTAALEFSPQSPSWKPRQAATVTNSIGAAALMPMSSRRSFAMRRSPGVMAACAAAQARFGGATRRGRSKFSRGRSVKHIPHRVSRA